ncbi:MAG: hypothetical protein Q9220_003898 [cf. Caloplaca sp. 1 TL-2023]
MANDIRDSTLSISSQRSVQDPAQQDHLSRLPNELLLSIIGYLRHDYLENFSGSCKLIHQLARPAMKIHLQRKKKYSTIYVEDADEDPHKANTFKSPMSLLLGALEDENLRDYTTQLIVESIPDRPSGVVISDEPVWTEYERGTPDFEWEQADIILNDMLEKKLDSIMPFFLWPLRDEYWVNCNATWGRCIRLLVGLFPRLQRLDLEYFGAKKMAKGIQRIDDICVGLGWRSSIHAYPSGLQHLREINISGYPISRQINFGLLYAFVYLPHLRRLTAEHVSNVWRDYDPDREQPAGPKVPLRSLGLKNTNVAASSVMLFLGVIKRNRLRSFSYCNGKSTEIPDIIDALYERAGESLQSLELIDWRDPQVRRTAVAMGSLARFSTLKRLNVECRVFIEPPKQSDASAKELSSKHKIAKRGLPRPIIDLLPPSLESLGLFQRTETDEEVNTMLEGVEVGCTALPNLKRVFVHRLEDGEDFDDSNSEESLEYASSDEIPGNTSESMGGGDESNPSEYDGY